MIRLQSVSTQF